MKKKISVTQYAELRGVSRQHVLNYLKINATLEGVTKSELIGKTWVLTVDKSYYDKLSMQAGNGFQASGEK